MEIIRYTSSHHREWNEFVENSSNGTFLFLREYMEYHAVRFADYSLLVCEGNELLALLPANRADNILYSHGGLTYGGLVMNTRNTTAQVVNIMSGIADYLRSEGFTTWIYKAIPHIYHRYPAESDLYALFRLGARPIGCNVSSAIALDNSLPMKTLRRRGIKKAMRMGLCVEETTDFAAFWSILECNLQSRFQVKPVHSLSEIELLHSRFPDNIRLFLSKRGDEVLAGSVVYDMDHIVHSQYISASPEGKMVGALDLLHSHLLGEVFVDRKWFDFGQSTEDMGRYLNEGLISQKEGFGGRGVVYTIYEIAL